MDDKNIKNFPKALASIAEATKAMGFDMASEPKTGALLRTLASSKPKGQFLELGTGTGLSAAWILDGMDDNSTLLSVDNDASAQDIASEMLGSDRRLTLVCKDAGSWLENNQEKQFDFIFADAWPGKFSHLKLALNLLAKGGIYIIDDLLPQTNWPDGHAPKVPKLIAELESLVGFKTVQLAWASGLMLVTKQ